MNPSRSDCNGIGAEGGMENPSSRTSSGGNGGSAMHGAMSSSPMSLHNSKISLSAIDEDDISLPLSLIKGLRRSHHRHHHYPTKSSTADSSSSSSDKDDNDASGSSGNEGGSSSNASSSTSKNKGVGTSLSIGTFGPMSSLSGSDEGGAGGGGSSSGVGRAGILRSGNSMGASSSEGASSSSENVAGDELSELVVVRGKSVASSSGSSSLPQLPQSQCKVSFSLNHSTGSKATGGGAKTATKRRRNQGTEAKESKNTSSLKAEKRPRLTIPQTSQQQTQSPQHGHRVISPKSKSSGKSSTSAPSLGASNQTGHHSVAAVSYSSSMGESGMARQTAGQESSSSSRVEASNSQPVNRSAAPSSSNLLPPQALSQESMIQDDLAGGGQRQLDAASPTSSSKGNIDQKALKFSSTHQHPASPTKHDNSEERRLERNQREKERSNRIASQVDALRCLLQRGGLFIPKNTKSTVLSEASNYIKTLQDRQQLMSLEMEGLRRQLVAVTARQQMQQGQQQGILPGIPPIPYQPMQASGSQGPTVATTTANGDVNKESNSSTSDSSEQDYHLIFKSTMAGMVVASMGGALLDCNEAFQTETGLSPKELEGMTVFNIVHPTDLSRALDLISRMIDCGYVASSNNDEGNHTNNEKAISTTAPGSMELGNGSIDEPVLLRSSFRQRPDLGLCVTLVRGEEGIAKCFSITLVKNVTPPTPISGPRSRNHGDLPLPFNPALPSLPSMTPPSSISGTSASTSSDPSDSGPDPQKKSQLPDLPNFQNQQRMASISNGASSYMLPAPQPPSTYERNDAQGKDSTINCNTSGSTQATMPVGASPSMPPSTGPTVDPECNSAPVKSLTMSHVSGPTPSPAVAGVPSVASNGVIPPHIMQLILMSQQQQQLQQSQPIPGNAQQPYYPVAQQSQQVQVPSQLSLNSGILQGVDPAILASVPGYPQNSSSLNPIYAAHVQIQKAASIASPSSAPSNSGNGGSGVAGGGSVDPQSGGPAYYASG